MLQAKWRAAIGVAICCLAAGIACSDRYEGPAGAAAGELATVATTIVPGVARDSTSPPAPSPGATPPAPPPQQGQQPQDGPWNHNLMVAGSTDGLSFGEAGVFVERGGVPSVIRDSGGRLVAVFQWFPFDDPEAFDRVAVAFSDDDGATWSDPAPVRVAGLPEGYMRPFDPAIVQIEDGRYRLYFTSRDQQRSGQPAIYSAISTDAIAYTFEEGTRFAPEEGTVDAAVVRFGGAWHLYSHTMQANTGRGYHATSNDGLAFEQAADVTAGAGRQWIGNAVVQGKVLRYYGSGVDGIWSATSPDGSAWTVEAGTRLRGGDPSAVLTEDGEIMLIFVGPARDDAVDRPPGR